MRAPHMSSDLPSTSAAGPVDPAAVAARHQSPWTTKQKLGRLAWALVQATLFRCSPHNFYGWRAFLLRTFGAKLAADVKLRRTVRIEVPWHLDIGEHTAIGDF